MFTIPVLVLDDDAPTRQLFEKVLSNSGFEVVSAGSIREAHSHLTAQQFAVMVCDMRLGDGNGIHFLQEVWGTLQAAQTQVVVVSAEEHYRLPCMEVGIDYFLSKPVSPMQLVALVGRLSNASWLGYDAPYSTQGR
jgi:two-component system, NtrC family, response regulator PilR